jgi:hypothetical protein
MGRQAPRDIVEVCERIVIGMLEGAGQGVEDRRCPATMVAPEEADRIPLPHPLCRGHDFIARRAASS